MNIQKTGTSNRTAETQNTNSSANSQSTAKEIAPRQDIGTSQKSLRKSPEAFGLGRKIDIKA